jgi:hypothetical protein
MGERTGREEPRGPNGHGPRGQGIWLRGATSGPISTSPFNHAFVSPEKQDTLIFPRFIKVPAAAKPLSLSRGVRSCHSRALAKGGNRRHLHHLSSLA